MTAPVSATAMVEARDVEVVCCDNCCPTWITRRTGTTPVSSPTGFHGHTVSAIKKDHTASLDNGAGVSMTEEPKLVLVAATVSKAVEGGEKK
jgi:hypothetical protein